MCSVELHGKVIKYEDLHNVLPVRESILDPIAHARVNNDLASRAEVLFLPTHLKETQLQDQKYKKATYKIILFGITPEGAKRSVILDGIQPYFEVRIPDATEINPEDPDKPLIKIGHGSRATLCTADDYKNKIRRLLSENDSTTPVRTETIHAKPFKYFQENKSQFLRCYYTKLPARKEAIKMIRSHGYETAHDDLNNYYRVVCRDYQTTFSTWAVLKNYRFDKCEYVHNGAYRLDIKDFKKYTGNLTRELKRDSTMSCGWDIETWSPDGDIPLPTNSADRVFCIGMTFQWVNDSGPFLKIALVDVESAPDPNHLTVVCGSETNLIRAFADVFSHMRPEFILGFNDSDYDWNWIVKRAGQTKGLLSYLAKKMDSVKPYMPYTDEAVMKWNYVCERVKLEADTNAEGYSLAMAGYIPVDVRTVFRKLHPTAEKSSLKWFLEKNKLSGKEDMPYQRMFGIYRDITTIPKDDPRYPDLLQQMAEVNKYCVIDAQRCHDLMKIRSVIMDSREVSDLAYCSVYDSFYRANGMKVRNLTISEGQNPPFNMRFSNITAERVTDAKYPGAYVFPPKKGLKTSKLSIKERIAKAHATTGKNNAVYQEWLNTTEDDIKEYCEIIKKHGAVVSKSQVEELSELDNVPKHFIQFLEESIGRPITGLDFSSLYPSLIRAYNFSPEYCFLDKKQAQEYQAKSGCRLTRVEFMFGPDRKLAWFVWHNNKMDPTDPEFQFGIYPYILDKLFNKRDVLKKEMKKYAHRKEELEGAGIKSGEEYEDVCFNLNYLNAKQGALKVFMNTFYGEAGNQLSPFFVVEVAGGITTYGKTNIKRAHKFVEDAGSQVYYGDSVAEYTPVLIRQGGSVGYCAIEDLATIVGREYTAQPAGKEIIDNPDCEVWSDQGWTKVRKIIRHKTDKQMYRVATHTGIVDVTEDHSLLSADGAVLKPQDALGKRLMTNAHPDNIQSVAQLTESPHVYFQCMYQKEKHDTCAGVGHVGVGYVGVKQIGGYFETYPITQEQFMDSTVVSVSKLPTGVRQVYDLETENHHFSAGIGDLVVHNTDSIYLSVPERHFAEIDVAYYTGAITKLDYWTQMVDITFREIKALNVAVNDMFYADNGTRFLKMAYEEVLYPVVFTAKKKYFGIPHENIVNFKPKDLFIRGLEVKKRGVSGLLRTIFMEIMWRCVDPDNFYTLLELVQQKIDEIYSRKWEPTDFLQSAVWRPKRQNVAVKTFVERMKAIGKDIPANERFNYVIVKRYPYVYDYRGRKTELKVGDRMELPETITNGTYEIDLDHYMTGSVNGQLARLITYHEMFHVEPTGETTEDIKIAEDQIYKNACKYVDKYCNRYYASYNTFGKTYQKLFKTADDYIGQSVRQYDEFAYELMSKNIKDDSREGIVDQFLADVNKRAIKATENYGKQFIEADLSNYKTKKDRRDRIALLQKLYYGQVGSCIQHIRQAAHEETINILKRQLREASTALNKIYHAYQRGINGLTDILKQALPVDEYMRPKQLTEVKNVTISDFGFTITDEIDAALRQRCEDFTAQLAKNTEVNETIRRIHQIQADMYASYVTIHRTNSIVTTLKSYRDTKSHVILRPNDALIDQTREELLNSDLTSLDI